MEELRSEMLEMRDMYMEEDVYQLQELRQQLEQVHVWADMAGLITAGLFIEYVHSFALVFLHMFYAIPSLLR